MQGTLKPILRVIGYVHYREILKIISCRRCKENLPDSVLSVHRSVKQKELELEVQQATLR